MIIYWGGRRKMNNGKKFFKEAGVLLIGVILIFSSGTALAITNTKNTGTSPFNRGLVWDNSIEFHGGDGGIFVATERSDGIAYPADDFQLDASQEVNSVFWQGGYFQCELAQGLIDYDWSWRILFWDDYIDGSHPGNEIYNWTILNTSITREPWYTFTNTSSGRQYWVANYSADLPETVTFEANKKYWITIRGIGEYPPQACWVRHNGSYGGIKLHEAVFKGTLWGYPDWINLSAIVSTEKIPHDFNYQLYGPTIQNNPPGDPSIDGSTTKLKPNTEYDYTLNAIDPETDDVSYFVDWGDGNNSGWTTYSGSGDDVILNHLWAESGTYIIKAKAKDIYLAESDWTELQITVPRTRSINNLLQQFLWRFPNTFPILRKLLI